MTSFTKHKKVSPRILFVLIHYTFEIQLFSHIFATCDAILSIRLSVVYEMSAYGISWRFLPMAIAAQFRRRWLGVGSDVDHH